MNSYFDCHSAHDELVLKLAKILMRQECKQYAKKNKYELQHIEHFHNRPRQNLRKDIMLTLSPAFNSLKTSGWEFVTMQCDKTDLTNTVINNDSNHHTTQNTQVLNSNTLPLQLIEKPYHCMYTTANNLINHTNELPRGSSPCNDGIHTNDASKVTQPFLKHLKNNNNKKEEASPTIQSIITASTQFDIIRKEIGTEIDDRIILLILSTRLSSCSTMIREDDIIGLHTVKQLIKEKIINPIRRPDIHLGLLQPPKGILLFGPPGTGKTLIAKWIACESHTVFFEVTPSVLISKFYGETESIITALFRIAELQSPSIIFIDEIDSVLGKRRENEDDNSIRMKNQFLLMIDGISSNPASLIILIGATNRPDMLDDAAIRRLSRRVFIPLPDLVARESQIKYLLIQHHMDTHYPLRKNNILDSNELIDLNDKDINCIAKQLVGWSCSDIKALCSKAADFPYHDAIKHYGTIDNIPNANVFRNIQYSDFLSALHYVKPSSISQEHLELWDKQFGSL